MFAEQCNFYNHMSFAIDVIIAKSSVIDINVTTWNT